MDGAAQAGERAAHEVWEKLARLSDMQIEPPPGKFQEQEPPSDEVPAAYSGTWLLFLSYPASSLPFMEYLTKSLSFGQKQDHRNSKPRCLLSQWRSVCSSRSEWLLPPSWVISCWRTIGRDIPYGECSKSSLPPLFIKLLLALVHTSHACWPTTRAAKTAPI